MDIRVVPNYGYVPFQYFQYFILALQVYMIYKHKEVNEIMDKLLPKTDRNYLVLKKLILSIPLLLIIYYDIRYSSFSLKNLGIAQAYNDPINQFLFILGSYAIVQVLAQDYGLKTGLLQRDTVQLQFIFAFISLGMAYSVTKNRSQSMIAVIIYFHLKYVISNNRTSILRVEHV